MMNQSAKSTLIEVIVKALEKAMGGDLNLET